jgi:hypothetical protein
MEYLVPNELSNNAERDSRDKTHREAVLFNPLPSGTVAEA